MRIRLAAAAACICAGAGALAAGPALADAGHPDFPGSTLQLAIQPPADPSSASFTVVASGTNVEQTELGVPGLDHYEVDQYLVYGNGPPCAATDFGEYLEESSPSGDSITLIDVDMDVGAGGQFSFSAPANAPLGYAGPVVICSYTDYNDDDAASATTTVNVVVKGDGPPQLGSAAPAGGGGTATQPTTTTPAQKPAVVRKPTVSRRGRRLVCKPGKWSGSPKSYRYAWRVVHKQAVKGRNRSLPVTRSLRGKKVECTVTATTSGGQSATATSRPYKLSG